VPSFRLRIIPILNLQPTCPVVLVDRQFPLRNDAFQISRKICCNNTSAQEIFPTFMATATNFFTNISGIGQGNPCFVSESDRSRPGNECARRDRLNEPTIKENRNDLRSNGNSNSEQSANRAPCSNMGIHHVGLHATNLIASAEFYRDVLGMEIVGGSAPDYRLGASRSSSYSTTACFLPSISTTLTAT
jgi:hypothetical protein